MNTTLPAPIAPAATHPEGHAERCDLANIALLRASGVDAAAFLQGQLTNDVATLAVGRWQYSAWCSPKGRMLANFVVIRSGDQDFELLFHASLAEAVRKRLAMFVLRSKLTIVGAIPENNYVGVLGPGAAHAINAALGSVPAVHEVVDAGGTRVLRLPGPRFLMFAAGDSLAVARGALGPATAQAGHAAWQLATIRAGVPIITQATSDAFVPQMANWDALGGVSFQKGCYTGQEIVARTQYLGRLKERLFLGHADALGIEAGQRVFSAVFADQPCGTVVNAVAAEDGCEMLVVLQTAAASSDDVHLGAPDGPTIALRALPYEVPAVVAARGRIA